MHGAPIHHARLTNGEIGNVDHLLNFAIAFGFDFAHFQCNQTSQRVLIVTQGVCDMTNRFAANRGRDGAPYFERIFSGRDDFLVLGLRR